MKIIPFFVLFSICLLLHTTSKSQSESWPIKAIDKSGELLDVKAFSETGEILDIFALIEAGSKHFLDVKAILGNKAYPVKIILSNDYYSPVKVIKSGKLLDVKAINKDGTLLDLKGVSRSGNTIRIAAVTATEEFLSINAISPEGVKRVISGIKFSEENIEDEIETIRITAHIKALPNANAVSDHPEWQIKAMSPDGISLDVFSTDKDGKEYDVKAYAPGGNFQLMDVKSIVKGEKIPVKLVSKGSNLILTAIDDVGREYPIKLKKGEGDLLQIKGVRSRGNLTDIKGYGKNGQQYAIKAVSPDGDIYDVKGIKAKKQKEEGVILGFAIDVPFYAHVKALPQIE